MHKPNLWTEIFHPSYADAESRWHDKLIESELAKRHGPEPVEHKLPDLSPLLSGAIQPSDFVKQWVKLPEWLAETQTPLFSREVIEYENEQRQLFDLAVTREEIFLDLDGNLITGRYRFRVIVLCLLCALTLVAVFVLGLSPALGKPFGSLDNLTFSSILLIPPTVCLFAYSRLMHSNNAAKLGIQVRRTRLASAVHAYQTYEEIRRGQRRIQLRESDRIERETANAEIVTNRVATVSQVEAQLREIWPETEDLTLESRLKLVALMVRLLEGEVQDIDLGASGIEGQESTRPRSPM